MGSGQLHLLIDGGGADVERSAEDERKSQDVVDLVGKIRAAGRHDDVIANGAGFVVGDFGIGIRHGEHHGTRRLASGSFPA